MVLGEVRFVVAVERIVLEVARRDGFAAFDTPAGRVGMLLCYDKLFPEAARWAASASTCAAPNGATPARSRETPRNSTCISGW